MNGRVFWGVALCAGLLGCRTDDALKVRNRTTVTRASKTAYEAHTSKVIITGKAVPFGAAHEVIGSIEVGKAWYGKEDKVYRALADKARELGADAVVEVKIWYKSTGLSHNAPHGAGKAVKFTVPFNFSILEGAKY